MKVASLPQFGGPDAFVIADRPVPAPAPGEVLIRVAAAGINRADVLQRRGLYPSPPGVAPWPGLEVSGTIAAVGAGVEDLKTADAVCALLPGGGYAEYAVCDASLVLPAPAGLTAIEIAALPEAACTVWSNMRAAGATPGQSILIHGGSGGIGTFALQLARAAGLFTVVTAGDDERVERCVALGADVGVNYRSSDFVAAVGKLGGVDIVLDCVGGDYLKRNLASLKDDGTLVVIGLQAGATAELNLAALLSRRLRIVGTALRSRPLEQRAAIVADVRENVWPMIPTQVRPVIHEVFPLADVASAHALMDERAPFGKVVLQVA